MKGGSFYNISRDLRVPNRETPLDSIATSASARRQLTSLIRNYFFLPVLTETTLTVGITIGRRIGTSPACGCCCCIFDSISVRT
jgi:argonaute-like protein implicated in RNA metabolism and viral defense